MVPASQQCSISHCWAFIVPSIKLLNHQGTLIPSFLRASSSTLLAWVSDPVYRRCIQTRLSIRKFHHYHLD
jgi:hypothetical protein